MKNFSKMKNFSNMKTNFFTQGDKKLLKKISPNEHMPVLTEKEKLCLNLLDENPKLYKPQTRQLAKLTEDAFGILWFLQVIEPNTKDYDKLKSFIGKTLNVFLEMDYTEKFDRLHIYNDDWTKVIHTVCMPVLLEDIVDAEQKENLNSMYKSNHKYGSERFDESRFSDVVFQIAIERQNYVSSVG